MQYLRDARRVARKRSSEIGPREASTSCVVSDVEECDAAE